MLQRFRLEIPLLSGDLPFLSLLIAVCNSSVVISGIPAVSSVIVVVHVSAAFDIRHHHPIHVLSHLDLVVLVKSFVEFTKDICNSFPRCDAFPFVVFYLL